MILINQKMKSNRLVSKLFELNFERESTNIKINTFLNDMLTYENNSLFLNVNGSQHPPNSNSIKQFYVDLTGFESILNSKYLSAFTIDEGKTDIILLSHYCGAIQQRKKSLGIDSRLVFIINIIENELDDDFDIWTTFHLLREGERYLDKNLDEYDENLMILIQ